MFYFFGTVIIIIIIIIARHWNCANHLNHILPTVSFLSSIPSHIIVKPLPDIRILFSLSTSYDKWAFLFSFISSMFHSTYRVSNRVSGPDHRSHSFSTQYNHIIACPGSARKTSPYLCEAVCLTNWLINDSLCFSLLHFCMFIYCTLCTKWIYCATAQWQLTNISGWRLYSLQITLALVAFTSDTKVPVGFPTLSDFISVHS